ncbi:MULTISPECIES: hypothetical protein [Rahnella]|uniref:Lipoprotein n=1 Tax=Rahnella laticis TaxID=2787622 RepID=A0ABS0E0B3_9GAMM|nr:MULTISPECIES: hypothetical protein [Rahnella]MBF7978527.1 hypothetical protein [Rahnella laticis]MBF7998617.1 hypothetical protein [Rahnella sp. LAC-M12]
MNFQNKITILLPVLVLLSGCYDRTDQTLSPPENARRVTVAVKVPDGITLLPMQMLYRSERCKTKSYNSSNEAYEIRGYNGFKQAFSSEGSNGIRQQRIAIDGGGPCQWQLNSLRVSFTLPPSSLLVKGKNVIETNYIFDFDDYGLSDGYGTGRAKEINGNINLNTIFFPMLINHLDNDVDLALFGGDTEYEQWRRRFRLKNTQNIYIEPVVHFNKVVVLNPPEIRPGNLTATYPDGSREEIPHISPDYEKLLSMK